MQEVLGIKDEYKIIYSKSFIARCSLADESVKAYYKELKETILSYSGVKSKITWQYDSFYYQREKKAILTIRGNSLTLYLALDPNEIDARYKINDESAKKSYQNTPLSIKIKGKRTFNYAKELIEMVFGDNEYKNHRLSNKNFNELFKARSIEELVSSDLIKERYRRKYRLNTVQIYCVSLVRKPGLQIVGNLDILGNWDPSKAVKMKRVYDNLYRITLRVPTCHLEFKIISKSSYELVEKGIWGEEIKNHTYDIDSNMIIEDIIHTYRK